jgi:hypothetical protein
LKHQLKALKAIFFSLSISAPRGFECNAIVINNAALPAPAHAAHLTSSPHHESGRLFATRLQHSQPFAPPASSRPQVFLKRVRLISPMSNGDEIPTSI